LGGQGLSPGRGHQYGYQIGNVLVTDFVTPNWLAHQYAQGNIDFKGHAQAPFEVLTRGYAQTFGQVRIARPLYASLVMCGYPRRARSGTRRASLSSKEEDQARAARERRLAR
jgi:hypothetical protein